MSVDGIDDKKEFEDVKVRFQQIFPLFLLG